MNRKRILIAPLDWGLGHASRCISVIKALQAHNCEVVLAGDGLSGDLLKKEFPDLPFLSHPNYPVTYPRHTGMILHFALKTPSMMRFIKKERKMLAEIQKSEKFHAVISDNRYGLAVDGIPSVLITHQLRVRVGLLSNPANSLLKSYFRSFSRCWVPDFENGERLGGYISSLDEASMPLKYIGPLSRFKEIGTGTKKTYDVTCILSGPEPLRTRFESELLAQLKDISGNHLLIRGTSLPLPAGNSGTGNIEIRGMAGGDETEAAIDSSDCVVARSGYSTIMDLAVKGRKAILIPSPGQPEQEYLGEYHRDSGRFLVRSQKKLDLAEAVNKLRAMPEVNPIPRKNILDDAVGEFCESLG